VGPSEQQSKPKIELQDKLRTNNQSYSARDQRHGTRGSSPTGFRHPKPIHILRHNQTSQTSPNQDPNEESSHPPVQSPFRPRISSPCSSPIDSKPRTLPGSRQERSDRSRESSLSLPQRPSSSHPQSPSFGSHGPEKLRPQIPRPGSVFSVREVTLGEGAWGRAGQEGRVEDGGESEAED